MRKQTPYFPVAVIFVHLQLKPYVLNFHEFGIQIIWRLNFLTILIKKKVLCALIFSGQIPDCRNERVMRCRKKCWLTWSTSYHKRQFPPLPTLLPNQSAQICSSPARITWHLRGLTVASGRWIVSRTDKLLFPVIMTNLSPLEVSFGT